MSNTEETKSDCLKDFMHFVTVLDSDKLNIKMDNKKSLQNIENLANTILPYLLKEQSKKQQIKKVYCLVLAFALLIIFILGIILMAVIDEKNKIEGIVDIIVTVSILLFLVFVLYDKIG